MESLNLELSLRRLDRLSAYSEHPTNEPLIRWILNVVGENNSKLKAYPFSVARSVNIFGVLSIFLTLVSAILKYYLFEVREVRS